MNGEKITQRVLRRFEVIEERTDVNKKADDFIKNFRDQLKIQRAESLKRFYEMISREMLGLRQPAIILSAIDIHVNKFSGSSNRLEACINFAVAGYRINLNHFYTLGCAAITFIQTIDHGKAMTANLEI
ncbi:Protein of unknown function DUF761, plant [Cynara cardunculus var. scolymus]|uniref:Uncharacterized protein n=1 Tax=Cynara cardunculus var. scolymus TaxID=59895 RepID=A0A118JTI4_CYNCS|nr:Protein of unknown function DUF761, plant [Cynara cardunculus var. scolymus]